MDDEGVRVSGDQATRLTSQAEGKQRAHARRHGEALLTASVGAGTVRSDIASTDLLRAVSGICMAGSAAFDDQAARLAARLGAADGRATPPGRPQAVALHIGGSP